MGLDCQGNESGDLYKGKERQKARQFMWQLVFIPYWDLSLMGLTGSKPCAGWRRKKL